MDAGGTTVVRNFLASFLFVYLFQFRFCIAIDVITPSQSIPDGTTIISAGERFELGFFSPVNSSYRFLGLWYKKIPEKIVWVANREDPILHSSGVLTINENGDLVLLDGRENIVWSTNVSTARSNSTAKLLESGNLVLRKGNLDANNREILWQSFDHPSDSFLPTMRLRVNVRTNESKRLKSWKSASDPSVGSFSSGIDAQELPQLSIWNESIQYWRSGPWNGQMFVGIPGMYSFYFNGFNVDAGVTEITYSFANASFITFFVLDPSGKLQQLTWDDQKAELYVYWAQPDNMCDVSNTCGSFGNCNPLQSPVCSCLSGFEPVYVKEWESGNWSGGCARRNQLKCERNLTNSVEKNKEDWFLKLEKVKLPDFPDWSEREDADDCQNKCLNNCSCVAYAYEDDMGCMLWREDLADIQKFSSGGKDIYIRLAYSELDKERYVKVIIITTVVIGTFITSISIYFCWRCMREREIGNEKTKTEDESSLLYDMGVSIDASDDSSYANIPREVLKKTRSLELLLFDFDKLVSATRNFSDANKLGEGGFGPVYKGKITEGKEIAVKRLSKRSDQGLEEFKNEVVLISKLQHRNLVRLLGCCIEGEEKMLVYEYMPNKSLDAFLFDPTKQGLLDWAKRLHIAEGIARGLLYLHRDSRLRIIHRDLKASNILLDGELNPKISDFGLARSFKRNEIQANTRKVVGTYGYMSPEYAMEGQFSEKSDVFSFGVLFLELVSGKKNTSFYHHEVSKNLLSYTWQLWNENKLLGLIDPSLGNSFSEGEALRCIHVGLLCVQEFAEDRPTMSSIVFMLGDNIAPVPNPKQPAFTERRAPALASEKWSINNVTITTFEGR